jgi:hypothetical protein
MPEGKRMRPEMTRELAEFAVQDFLEWYERQREKNQLPAGPVRKERLAAAPTPAIKRDPWAGKPQWLAEVLSVAVGE